MSTPSDQDRVPALVAIGIVLSLLAYKFLWSTPGLTTTDGIAAAVAVLSLAALYSDHRIARINLYVVEVGQAFPAISDADPGQGTLPGQGEVFEAARQTTRRSHSFTFDFVARATEPNAATRILAYAKSSDASRRTLDPSSAYLAEASLLENAPRPRWLLKLAQHLRSTQQIADDLLPLVRIVLGRTLYPKPPRQEEARDIYRTEPRPEHPSARLEIAYRFYLLPLIYWSLLLSFVALLVPGGFLCLIDRGSAKMLLATATIGWGLYALSFHSRLLLSWKQWLSSNSFRPLGHLPIFIHCSQNHPEFAWEELHESDFQDHLTEFMLDSATMFNIVVGSFTIVALAIIDAV